MAEPPSKRFRTGRVEEDQGYDENQDLPSQIRNPSNLSRARCSTIPSEEMDCDVLIVGAGPAGLMLACNLARFGVNIIIVDDRPEKTSTGRGDGLQPKTIETLRHLGLADELLSRGVKVYDICFWESTETSPLCRTGRQIHYPASSVDTLDPYVLLVHQGMIENVLIEDLASNYIHVERNTSFLTCEEGPYGSYTVNARVNDLRMAKERTIRARFVIGCDGAHSNVRESIPESKMVGDSGKSEWGVIDGVLNTNFPDIWSKAVVQSRKAGSLLCIPREENMTRLYVELGPNAPRRTSNNDVMKDFTMRKSKEILDPFSIHWESVVWSSVYTVSQRVASCFISDNQTIYLVGDAAHTHSPKAAQGMNVSMHDSFNLAWKLNLFLRGVGKPSLLMTYEEERAHVAQQLVDFDVEHAKAFQTGDARDLAENFDKNIRFISGIGVEYQENIINIKLPEKKVWNGQVKVGALLPPARVTRYIDSNPVHIQLDIPLLGQFRVYFLVSNIHIAQEFLKLVGNNLISGSNFDDSLTGQAASIYDTSYERSQFGKNFSNYKQIDRYTTASRLFTLAIVTTMEKDKIEIRDLPPVFENSPWTFYLDNKPVNSCTKKWVGGVVDEEVIIINVRPDGYVASMNHFDIKDVDDAICWFKDCFYFLKGFVLPKTSVN